MSDNEAETTGRRRRRPAVAVFEDSGLTEEDRRKLRRKQRDLYHQVDQEIGRGGEEDRMDFLSRNRDSNNKLFSKVAYTREATLDAENAQLIAVKTLQEVDQMVQVPRFDGTKLAAKLRSKLSSGSGSSVQFNWKHFGRECGVCFNAIPTGVSFLAGTMEYEESVARKARKPREKRNNVDLLEEQRPELMDNSNKGDADNLSAADKAMRDMKKKIKKHSKRHGENDTAEVDGVKFLFNPKSFTQTVENIFHYSFFVKKGETEIGVRTLEQAGENKLPGLYVKQIHRDDDDDQIPDLDQCTQAVVAFTMRDWKRICTAHQLEEGLLPHRVGSKHSVREKLSQQSVQDDAE
mmetsp:Transcript_21864/g.28291  ORF Transcript_21864/g.28291 Transcript_21864/m.28291 type:complete len:349 (-) Transcript_21864:79-1125(-)|eukprot:CAMPEP_0198150918 /NCGR_PEP_ID=MMETSP1443-20131203/53195_1 /TAXON_ID=186043 /ORGANISM="Entomoneis sp., Strain CCMP2396" /LENGTH=348 /DNA_ID=CAMNT_0043816393 /DNA_START=17 /DNA_END=1063 /DNA_ORIENTATION=+